ncbi:hypothetical protein HanRHA438_Chr02g0079941 [Helianthus annuus]|uniref:Uncharacterized protein n=1 Tax=Helianthus annuus TaxID=4232 RepID=A0A9K3NZQ8_HELAN|nr:hypothetical protein HanXRQr2_Chr02g0068841 [Helianthus annuus]KAJ0604925.1 hypothetical protein HanHA300_Chr02g0057241 [Helianthus annuus]KAJ0618940.1 hypothetical protein HanHA89_Chr02g0065741 [Helianthus annuus]KAJ0940131.1 hypothetical protein HanRHA438_Chr02g0079941 [Helianthus annuus]
MPYKFLVHSVIHTLGHRKGGYDVSVDYIMCILTCLILNRPYNISQVIFNHMVDIVKGEKFLQYARFVQMLLDDQIKDLPKEADDELVLEHMDNETLKRLQVYKGKGTSHPARKKFVAIENHNYEAPPNEKWRHDNSGSDDEDMKMELFVNKISKWWLKDDDKKKKKKATTQKTPKAASKRSTKKTTTTPHLVDEPSGDEAPHGNENVEGGEAGSSQQGITAQELEDMIARGETGTAKNVGGETRVEGIVQTDSSETESDNQILTSIANPMDKWRKKKDKPSKKRKGSDKDDASY